MASMGISSLMVLLQGPITPSKMNAKVRSLSILALVIFECDEVGFGMLAGGLRRRILYTGFVARRLTRTLCRSVTAPVYATHTVPCSSVYHKRSKPLMERSTFSNNLRRTAAQRSATLWCGSVFHDIHFRANSASAACRH